MADIAVTGANVVPSTGAQLGQGTAGATITQGQWVYLDSGTNTLKLADANASAATAAVVGVALESVSSGQPLKYQYGGDITIGGTVAAGAVYVQSGTAGAMAPVADLVTGWYTTVLGIGLSTTKITILLAQPSTLTAVP